MKKTIKILLLFNIYLGLAQSDVPLTLLQQFNGKYGYTIIGNTHNEFDNWQNPSPPCQMLSQTSVTLNLNSNQNIVAAYLSWNGIGDGQTATPTFNNINVIPDQIHLSNVNPSTADPFIYFSAIKDVTNNVIGNGNGLYTFSNFNLNSIIGQYCSNGIYFSGWYLIVIYENSLLPNIQLNIYNGFKFVGNNNINNVNIQIENLNIIDSQNSNLTYIAWNGSPNLNFNESISINNNLLSNPLNPSNNPFNGTNSFTGSTNSWNMDIDTFDISPYINIGDTSANITMNSVLIRFIQTIITSIRSELPDASVQTNTVTGQEICGNRNLAINYTVANTNSNAVLPANVPVSFYANNTLLQTIFTTAPVAIGASLPLSQNVTIPLAIPNNFVLKIKVNDNGTGASTVAESNLNNNESTQNITLSSDTVTPTFSIPNTFCQNATVPVLPLNSNNGISGTWSPNVINNQVNGSYIFTPNIGQCANAFILNVSINPNVTPTFTLANTFCQGANVPVLPLNSNNGISGTWSPNVINNQTNGSYVFTPNAGQCANAFILNVTISPLLMPIFNIQNTFCQGANVPVLPLNSNNGISGTWSPNIINNQTNGSYIFTPNIGQCANAFTLNVSINPNVTPTFTLANTFCQGANVLDLPLNSNNGISGTWSPNVIDNQTNGSYIFTPNTGQCANAFTLNVTISPLLMPIFNIQNTFCQGANVPVLPLNSNNGISGTWSPNDIDNQVNGSYVFTPNAGQCANSFTLNVTINTNVTPTFTQVAPICAGGNLSALPTISNNNITGNWSPVLNNSSTTTYTFTPNSGQCSNTQTMTIVVNPTNNLVIPDGFVCVKTNGINSGYIINSGLSSQNHQFQWFKIENDGTLTLLNQNVSQLLVTNPGKYKVIATQNNSNCVRESNEITINAIPEITDFEYTILDPFTNNTSLIINGLFTNDFTFQIDNFPPQTENIFTNAPFGTRIITIKDQKGCTNIQKRVQIMGFLPFFTPNGDSYNDVWKLYGFENTKATLKIFDRYGKILYLAKDKNINNGWDGTYNNLPLPATDYWFTIEYEENKETKIFKGNFGLKR